MHHRTTLALALALAGAATLASPAARAGHAADVARAFRARGPGAVRALDALLADAVRVGPLLFHDPACARFDGPTTVTGPDRHELAACLAALHVEPNLDLPSVWSDVTDGAVFELVIERHKIAAIGPVAPAGADAHLPTLVALGPYNTGTFMPSPGVRAKIEHTAARSVHVWVKSCIEGGRAGTNRIIGPSGLPGFDREAAAYLQNFPMPGDMFQFAHHRVAAGCLVWKLGSIVAPRVRDLVQPVRGQHVDDENGVTAGTDGVGDTGDDLVPPPPPPPPRIVPPTALESLRLAGDRQIYPDPATQKLMRARRARIIASFKLCVARDGVVSGVVLLRSSGYAAYDAALTSGMRRWRFKPYRDANGHAVPVCTAETFIYRP